MSPIKRLNPGASRVPLLLATLAALSWSPWASAYAQGIPGGGNEIEVLEIRPNFFMIAGSGGNIGVQIG